MTTEAWQTPERYSLRKTVLLHLAPGVPFTPVFPFAAWNYLVFFLASLPLAYYVRLRGNILPTIITHVLFNSVGVVFVLTGGVLPS